MEHYLIVGLGNIGLEYNNTRHNIGFDVIDKLASELKLDFSLERLAIIANGRLKNKQITLIKPTTFMNLSGKAVSYYAKKLNIDLTNILIITDDFSLPIGALRLRTKGSHGGHNGLRSVEELLQTPNYFRLRFGIGNEFLKAHQTQFVLGKWKPDEENIVSEKILLASNAVQSYVLEGMAIAMNKYNGK